MAIVEEIARSQMGPDEIPPGAEPVFGDSPGELAAWRNELILSAEAHSRLADDEPVTFDGKFSLRQPGLMGHVQVEPTETPGLVHLRAEVQWEPSGVVHFDADVRESWLEKAAGPERSAAAVLKALAEVSELPRQNTVRVTVDRDDMGLDVG
ncbi:MAG: hypothetical protein C0506_15555 [Anaerolinea sp.]|nr:hypothetical protein [Anaerolinea sp.]